MTVATTASTSAPTPTPSHTTTATTAPADGPLVHAGTPITTTTGDPARAASPAETTAPVTAPSAATTFQAALTAQTAPATSTGPTHPNAAPTGPTPAPAPFAEQLGARLTALGGLAHGRHVLTVPVDPEHLGPVRVVAHIAADQVRVELVGGTEASREALRGALADLRRDLARDLGGLDVQVGVGGDAPSDRPDQDQGPARTAADARPGRGVVTADAGP
ncbi:flagellar hook-length control protein FliK, partial [Cellulomonas algicola]|uniref:flagellar hook-length control protein FliK n=1 Tax=Cellulomonas algicola TaxID=2071633 RepID=UPI001B3570B3